MSYDFADKIMEAYDYMIDCINEGTEFSIAHEDTVWQYNLADGDSRALIDMYDNDQAY